MTTKKFKIFAYIFAVSLVSAGWYFYYFLLPHAIERDKLLQKYIPEEVEYIALYGFEKAKNYKKRIRVNIKEKNEVYEIISALKNVSAAGRLKTDYKWKCRLAIKTSKYDKPFLYSIYATPEGDICICVSYYSTFEINYSTYTSRQFTEIISRILDVGH